MMKPGGRAQATLDPWSAPEERARLVRSILWSADRLAPLAAAFGVRHAVFMELLRVRLVLGQRPRGATSAWGVAGMAVAVGMIGLAGLGTGLAAFSGPDARTWIVVSLSVLLVLIGMLLFQLLAGILVDPTDVGVVAPHPVDDRTVFAVRIAEVFAYLLVCVASFAAANVAVALLARPSLGVVVVYPLLAVLCGITTLGLVALLFALCLRGAGPAGFRRAALWAQILGGALLFSGYQVFRAFEVGPLLEPLRRYRDLWPPCQLAELYELACGGGGAPGPAVAALVTPAVALALALWLVRRTYVAGLQGTPAAPAQDARWEPGFLAGVARRVVHGAERVGFDFAAALSRREPHFLAAVLPQLLMFQALALGMAAGMRRDLALFLPMSAAFVGITVANVMLHARGSSTPQARELFERVPIADASALLRGGVKGLLVQWTLLPGLAVLATQLAVAGLEVLPRAVLALELALVLALFLVRRLRLPLPFTQPVRVGQTGAENFGVLVVGGMAMALLAGVHVVLSLHPLGLVGGMAASGWLLARQWRGLAALRLPGEGMQRSERRGDQG